MMNNKKKTKKTVVFDVSGMLAVKVVITFEEGDFDDEQLEYIARLDFAARQNTCNDEGVEYGNGFFEDTEIINYTSTNNIEIYGKKFAFTKFREKLLDEKEKRVLNSYMIIKIDTDEFKPIGIVEISSTVDSLDAPFQHHFDSWYEGIEPCTKKDLAEFTVLLPSIRYCEKMSINNMLGWKTVLRTEGGTEFSLEDLTEEQQMALGEAVINSEYDGF